MQNPNDLKQAIQALESKTKKETDELNTKEKELENMEIGMPKVKQEIITLERTLEEKRAQLREFERKKPQLMANLRQIRVEHQKNKTEIERIHGEYTRALQKSNTQIH